MTAAVRQQPAAVSRLTGPFSRAALVPHVPIKFFSDYTYTYVQGRHLFLPIYIYWGGSGHFVEMSWSGMGLNRILYVLSSFVILKFLIKRIFRGKGAPAYVHNSWWCCRPLLGWCCWWSAMVLLVLQIGITTPKGVLFRLDWDLLLATNKLTMMSRSYSN